MAAIASGEPGAALLVERLDVPDRPYYLVPWLNDKGVVLVAQVDAIAGALASMAVLPNPAPSLVMTSEQAQALVEARFPVIGPARLVWQPCRESMSPLQPFYQVPIRSGVIYVAVDGSLHRQLADLDRGG